MKSPKALAWVSGLTGVGLLIVGGVAYARRGTPMAGLGFGRGRRVYGKAKEAPIVSQRSVAGYTTTMREMANMPIEVRVATIQQKIRESVQDGRMRKIALQATAHCPERDGVCEARAIYDFVKSRVRYTGDIAPIKWEDGKVEGVDLFQTAYRTLEFGGGDCDDHNILISTLLANNGITPRLRVVKTRGAEDWEHIFTGALLPKGTGNKFYALDTTLPGNDHFGREPTYHKYIDFDA